MATGICGVPVFTNFGRMTVIASPAVSLNPVPRSICENGTTTFLANGSRYSTLQWQVLIGGTWSDITDNDTYYGSATSQLSVLNAPATFNGYQYRLAFMGICSVTYTNPATLTVNSNPVVNFPAPLIACGGVPVVINGNPTGGSGVYTIHRWTGDVGPLNNYNTQTPTFNSQVSGDYNLNYKVTDNKGCSANDTLVVKVDSPSALYTKDVDNGCAPLTVAFTRDMSDVAKFWWDFGEGSPVDSLTANPVHLFTNANTTTIGYYNVKLKVRSAGGCIASFTSVVTVYPKIDATFTPGTLVVCSGNQIVFTSIPGASKYFWEYGDGANGYATNTTSHLYTNITTEPVVHEVKLTTTSFYSCVDVKTLNITVMPVPVAQFSAVPVQQIYNSAGNPVTFTNETNPGTWTWLWKFGDGATTTTLNANHTYAALGEYTVTLIARNTSCSDSVKHNVSVVPEAPVAAFDSIPSGCAPVQISLNNTSLHTDLPGTTYKWEFGDGSISTAKNPRYTYFEPGVYRISLFVNGPGGVSGTSRIVNVYPSPRAFFDFSPDKVKVNDEKVRFFNLSENSDYWVWEFGDGDTSHVKEPFHRYMKSGVFPVTLWAYSNNGCSDKYLLEPGVTVEPPGIVRFATVFTPNKEGPIERTDLPTGGTEIDQFFFPPIREQVTDYKLQIFNRWGVLIFEQHDINVPWNGYYKGKLCPQGVYVWYVEGKYIDGQPFKMVGDVTLLH
jgi:PKD repeat protein